MFSYLAAGRGGRGVDAAGGVRRLVAGRFRAIGVVGEPLGPGVTVILTRT
jgi:hypothetical protein